MALKEYREAIKEINSEIYFAWDTADRTLLSRIQKDITRLQKFAKEVDERIDEDIKTQAEKINS